MFRRLWRSFDFVLAGVLVLLLVLIGVLILLMIGFLVLVLITAMISILFLFLKMFLFLDLVGYLACENWNRTYDNSNSNYQNDFLEIIHSFTFSDDYILLDCLNKYYQRIV